MLFTNKYTETLLRKLQSFAKSRSLQEAIELYKDGEFINIYTVFTGLTDCQTITLLIMICVVCYPSPGENSLAKWRAL